MLPTFCVLISAVDSSFFNPFRLAHFLPSLHFEFCLLMRFNLRLVLFLASGLLLLMQCANPVMPTGGLKDTLPPQVISSVPEPNAVNFAGTTVEITFNEFIKLDKINQQALISPPPNENPEFRLKGKTLQIRFKEELKPETTYTLFFGNAIVDLTEGNPLAGYTFVFSTGPVLDSMAFRGRATLAFDEKPAESVYVLLYRIEDDTIPVDSLPFFKKPYYVARADKKGFYRFSNLRNESYRMFALEDKNSNLLYDKGGEAIGFAGSIVQPQWLPLIADTLSPSESSPAQDSLGKMKSSAKLGAEMIRKRDSMAYARKLLEDSLRFSNITAQNLRLFYEVDSTQKLLRAEVIQNGHLRFAFRYPAQNVTVREMDSLPQALGLLKTYSRASDTLHWYYRDSVLDSIRVVVKLDTLIHDTLQLSLYPKAQASRRGGKKKETVNGLTYVAPVSGRKLEPGQAFALSFPEPVVHYQMRDTNRLIAKGDTLFGKIRFSKADEIGLRYVLDSVVFEPEGDYQLRIPDSVFVGLSGKHNDTIDLQFRIPALSEYGNLLLSIVANEGEVWLVQLLQGKEEVLSEKQSIGSSKLVWERLKPGKLKVKAILDRNNNGRWDTGDLVKGIQPEQVTYLEKELEIRANWDLEEEWRITLK